MAFTTSGSWLASRAAFFLVSYRSQMDRPVRHTARMSIMALMPPTRRLRTGTTWATTCRPSLDEAASTADPAALTWPWWPVKASAAAVVPGLSATSLAPVSTWSECLSPTTPTVPTTGARAPLSFQYLRSFSAAAVFFPEMAAHPRLKNLPTLLVLMAEPARLAPDLIDDPRLLIPPPMLDPRPETPALNRSHRPGPAGAGAGLGSRSSPASFWRSSA